MISTNQEGIEQNYHDFFDTCYNGSSATLTWTGDSLIYTALACQNINQEWSWGFYKIDTSGNILSLKDISYPLVIIMSTIRTFEEKYLSVGSLYEENKWHIYAYKLNSDLEYDTIYNTSFVYDSLCPYSIPSDTTDMDCDILVLVEEEFIPLKDFKLKIYPNPAIDHITISFPDVTHSGQREIIIFNSLGVEVKRVRLMKGDEETRVNVSELPAGIYFVVMTDLGQRIGEGKFVVIGH